ncbi:MAG: ATP-binding protein [Anaerolineales bacterium]
MPRLRSKTRVIEMPATLSAGELALTERLNDLWLQAGPLENLLRDGLALIVNATAAAGGLLVVQPPGASEPLNVIAHTLPVRWQQQLADPSSALNRAIELPVGASTLADSSLLGVLTTAPLELATGQYGKLFLSGVLPDEHTLTCLTHWGRAIARAIHAQLARPTTPDRDGELAALNKIAATLTATVQLDEILPSIIDGIRELLHVEAASLLLLDEEHGEMIFKKTLAEDTDWIFQYSMDVGQGLVGECVRTGKPLLVNNAKADPRFYTTVDAVTGFDTRSVLCAPLITREQTLGAIEVINKQTSAFDAHDQELLMSMTGSVAIAIQNARLFHKLTVANADLEASRWEVTHSRNTLRALFDGIPHPIYIVDRNFKLVALNLSAARIAGAPNSAADLLPNDQLGDTTKPQALVGRLCYEALYDRATPCVGCRILETLTHGQSTQRSERRWETDNQPTEWEISTYPIKDANGYTLQAVLFLQDVTDKRRLEASLAQSEKLAAVGQLAAGVAHEINNPLTAIIANTQLLQRELPAGDARESVTLIALAGERALKVVRSLLDFARQERYEFTPTDVNASIQSALRLVENLLNKANVQVITEFDGALVQVPASHDHLQGVWLNFLLNARDALNDSTGDIRVTTRQYESELHVTIADTGVGIAPEQLRRIFEPFYTTKEPGRGTGLGLSTCHRIIKQHGGHIRVDSRVGHGTVFTVVLPTVTPLHSLPSTV